MVIINHYINKDSITLELRSSYVNGSETYSTLLNHGFKWNKFTKLYSKSYYQKEYIDDTFDRDINKIKELWKDWQFNSYKLVTKEKSYSLNNNS